MKLVVSDTARARKSPLAGLFCAAIGNKLCVFHKKNNE